MILLKFKVFIIRLNSAKQKRVQYLPCWIRLKFQHNIVILKGANNKFGIGWNCRECSPRLFNIYRLLNM